MKKKMFFKRGGRILHIKLKIFWSHTIRRILFCNIKCRLINMYNTTVMSYPIFLPFTFTTKVYYLPLSFCRNKANWKKKKKEYCTFHWIYCRMRWYGMAWHGMASRQMTTLNCSSHSTTGTRWNISRIMHLTSKRSNSKKCKRLHIVDGNVSSFG